MYTLTNLEQLGVPLATHLLEDPAPDSQVTDIVRAILGELEAQIFQLLETEDGRASASQWLAALLDAPPGDFLGARHKAGLEALRSVVLWDAREIHAVTAALGYVEGSASLEEKGARSMHRMPLQVLAHSPPNWHGSVGKGPAWCEDSSR